MWEVIGIITGIFMLLLSAFGLWISTQEKNKQKRIKEFEEKRQLKESERELRDELRMANFRGGLTEEISNILNLKLSAYETNDEAKESYKKLWEKLDIIEDDLDEHFKDSKKSEIGKLACEITAFGEDLKNGIRKTEASFKQIISSYNRYKELGGNHYVDEVYKIIIERLNEVLNEGE